MPRNRAAPPFLSAGTGVRRVRPLIVQRGTAIHTDCDWPDSDNEDDDDDVFFVVVCQNLITPHFMYLCFQAEDFCVIDDTAH